MAEEQTITIDGVAYRLSDLSDQAKGNIASLRGCDQKLQLLQQEMAIVQTARAAYAGALKNLLPAQEEGAAADAPATDA